MSLENRGAQHQMAVVDKYHNPDEDYQMTTRDYVLRPTVDAAAITITLPPVAEAKGRFYSFKVTGNVSVALPVTLQDQDDSEGWEGDIVLKTSGASQLLYSDGRKWQGRTITEIRLTGRIYSNQYDSDHTVLKIHNHDTTAEIGGLEIKTEFKNATGLCLGQANYCSYEPTGDTGTPTQLSAGVFVVAVDTGITMTSGNMYALEGHAQLYGTMNGAAVNVAGVVGIISSNGAANTLVLHMAGIQSAMSTGLVNPTTGTLSYYLANSLSTVVVDNLICSLQSQYVTNFASFDGAAVDKQVEVNVNAMTLTQTAYHIRVLIEGTPYYIPCFDAKTWT